MRLIPTFALVILGAVAVADSAWKRVLGARPQFYVGVGHTLPITAAAWRPDGCTQAMGSGFHGAAVSPRDATGRYRQALPGTRVELTSLAWSPETAIQTALAASPEPGPFIDVPRRHWARETVGSLAAMGLINGYADGRFRGNQPITRYETAFVVQRILQEPLHRDPAGPVLPQLPTTAPAPVDVPASHWAADAVADAHRWGLLIGYPGSFFAGDRPITRGEFNILLHRLRMAALQRLVQHGVAMTERPASPPTFISVVGLKRRLTRYEFCVGLERLIESLQQVMDQRQSHQFTPNHPAMPAPPAGQGSSVPP